MVAGAESIEYGITRFGLEPARALVWKPDATGQRAPMLPLELLLLMTSKDFEHPRPYEPEHRLGLVAHRKRDRGAVEKANQDQMPLDVLMFTSALQEIEIYPKLVANRGEILFGDAFKAPP